MLRQEKLLNSVHLTPNKARKLRRPSLLGNALLEVATEKRKKKTHREHGISMVASKIAYKYRCLNYTSKVTGLDRKFLERRAEGKRKDQRVTSVKKLQGTIREFLEREDNVRMDR